MALDLRQVHETRFDIGSNQTRIISESHRLCFTYGSEQYIVNEGEVYFPNGTNIPKAEVPEKVWDDLRRCSPQARKTVMIQLPEDKITTTNDLDVGSVEWFRSLPPEIREQLVEEVQTATVPKGHWRCPECTEVMINQRKGLHMQKHNNEHKRHNAELAEMTLVDDEDLVVNQPFTV